MKTINFNKYRITFLVFFSLLSFQGYSQKLELKKNWWMPNGTVETIVEDTARRRILIGGRFTSVGPYQPNGAMVDYYVGSCEVASPAVEP